VVCILSWGPTFSVAKRSLEHVDAFALGSIRYVLGVAIFVALLAATEGREGFRYGTRLWPAIVFGIIGIVGFNLLVWFGLNYTRPEHAAVLMALQTPLTALALWLLGRGRPDAITLACIVVAILGVVLVVTKGNPGAALHGGTLVGDLLILLGALAWVAYTLAGARFIGWSPLKTTTLTCIPGGVCLLVVNLAAVAGGQAEVPSPESLAAIWWQLIYFAVGSVVLGVLGFNAAVRHLGAVNTMLMLNMVPVFSFAIEAALGQRFLVIELAGGALVVGALVANNLWMRVKMNAQGRALK